MAIKYQQSMSQILRDLPLKKREIIERRFGINRPQRETLQSIGNDFNITRERVRQIVNESIYYIKETSISKIRAPINYISDYLQSNGDLKREDYLLTELGGQQYQNHIYFYLTIGDEFQRFNEDQDFYTVWTIKEKSVIRAKTVVQTLMTYLDKKKQPLPLEELHKPVKRQVHIKALHSYIETSKHISRSPEGLFGLIFWPEVNPKSIRDKAYIVLKRKGEPLRFQEITDEINRFFETSKNVSAESVHNELIRSSLFVLVGRGLYALREWGYEPGTVKDIIIKTLKESKKPLLKEEIVEKVLQQRKVEANTVILNLQDRTLFERDEKGGYSLKNIGVLSD